MRDRRPVCKACGAPMDQRVLPAPVGHVIEHVCTVCYGREPR